MQPYAPEAVSFPGDRTLFTQGFVPEQPEEQLVRRWLSHWDTVNGEFQGIDEILADDFVSHNMPEGDRDAMMADVEAFRSENPNSYFSVDDLVVVDGRAFPEPSSVADSRWCARGSRGRAGQSAATAGA